MKILEIKCFKGRNIYSHRPVIKMEIDVGELHEKPTKDLAGFNERLLNCFPGLKSHCCSTGYEGGFKERLDEGTYMPHVLEHLILELQHLAGYETAYGKARVLREPSIYNIIFEYKNEECGIECARAGVSIVVKLLKGIIPDTGRIIESLRETASRTELGPSTRAIYDECIKRGIPVTRMGNESIIQIGCGKNLRLIEAAMTDRTTCINADIASNKHLTKEILSKIRIPVPEGRIAHSPEEAVETAEILGYPVVLKPVDGNQGKGVMLGLESSKEVYDASRQLLLTGSPLIVERHIKGSDYRLLVVGDRVCAAAERRPPLVVGDGKHSIRELVDIENRSSLRGEDHEKPLTKIKFDAAAESLLMKKGLDKDYIPSPGEEIILRDNGNISTGGTARNCTGEVHSYNSMLAVRAAEAVGLDIAGIDIVAQDISKPIDGTNGAVLEVNAAPGLRMHLHPSEGESINVAQSILDMMYPAGEPYSIPIVSITGTNGKTTTTRLIKHALSLSGKNVGMTSTSGIYIGDKCIMKGDNTGAISASIVLSSQQVEAAVLETARGGIVNRGLGYDLADVGVIVNISEDHLGADGLNSVEDLSFVKSLVVEAVKEDGYAVLNADDPQTPYFLSRVKSNVILFSKSDSNELVLKHLKQGNRAVYVKGGMVVLRKDRLIVTIANIEDIPITINGMVQCNVENTLAAVSALYGLDMPVGLIKQAITTFRPDEVLNPGRFNIFEMGGFKVMLDYCHNPAGYKAVVDFAGRLNFKRLVGVIGMPGDRQDRHLMEAGTICGKTFSKIYIKEDRNLRGREPGEVAGIFFEAVVKEGVHKDNIKVIYSEDLAFEAALKDAEPGDLIIMFYEDFEPVYKVMQAFREKLEKSCGEQISKVHEAVSAG